MFVKETVRKCCEFKNSGTPSAASMTAQPLVSPPSEISFLEGLLKGKLGNPWLILDQKGSPQNGCNFMSQKRLAKEVPLEAQTSNLPDLTGVEPTKKKQQHTLGNSRHGVQGT